MKISDIEEDEPFVYTKEEPDWGVTINGPTEGGLNIEHTYTLNSNCLYGIGAYEYLVDWGDGTNNTIITGPFDVDESVPVSHTWIEEGNYEITVKAIDIHRQDSEESDPLVVTMPRKRASQRPFLQFLEQYPILYQLLQRFLRL